MLGTDDISGLELVNDIVDGEKDSLLGTDDALLDGSLDRKALGTLDDYF